MSQELMNKVAEKVLKKQVPAFQVGDTVNVSNKIVEGDKERVQVFRGTVIARRGRGVGQTFIVRRIVNNEGVERTFPLHSPMLVGVDVVRAGRTRRAKLYYLRQRIGKATRLRDIMVEGEARPAAGAAQAQGQPASKE